MTRTTWATAAVMAAAAFAVAAPAQAADWSYGARGPYTVSQPLNGYSWAGPYLGGNLGYNWGSVSHNPTRPSGFSGGIQAGYNVQSGPLVIGLEGDLQLNGAENRFAGWKFNNPWFGTVRGRLGYAMNNVLIYGTGGLAFGTLNGETALQRESHLSAGWTVGVGAEFGLTQNISAKVEYLYVDLSNNRFGITGTDNGYSFGMIRAGVNYRF
ncbi:MAG: outer membrane protein [Xanthobacteraceae bacterium]